MLDRIPFPGISLVHPESNRDDVVVEEDLDSIPAVPITRATRRRLELLVVGSPVLDLRAITEVILRDPGATLQLLRAVGEEFGLDECRPIRIEHCIAGLNRERWYGSVCASIIEGQDCQVSLTWQQFVRTAQHLRSVAARFDDFDSEEAYLVGLLHQIGKLPRLLGWTAQESCSLIEERRLGIRLARHWNCPFYLLDALRQQYEGMISSRWNLLLHAAHSEVAQQSLNKADARVFDC